ncbi:MAG TPA: VOC family protein [Polyangiales bacterium]|nr:VOC family protein [Polyangiales bacterium]
MSSRFCRFELRTTHVSAASDFYVALFGRRDLIIRELPISARTRGAPAHWLGYLSAAALGGSIRALQRWTEHGAMPIGARVGDGAVVRDPGGAMLALTDSSELVDAGVGLHVLLTPNADRAAGIYSELFGWALTESFELGAGRSFQQFAWRAGEPNAGAIGDIAGHPEIHAQWQFFFEVQSLDVAIEHVREQGGKVIGPTALPDGRRIAACDDPQGAAFGLVER